jgi:cation transporter-like permease
MRNTIPYKYCQSTRTCHYHLITSHRNLYQYIITAVLLTGVSILVPSSSSNLIVSAFQPKLLIASITTTFGDWNRQQQQQQVFDNQTNQNSRMTNSNKKKKQQQNTDADDAAVLRELKEIIQKQANEIIELKKKQLLLVSGGSTASATSASASSQHHSGHGPAVDIDPVELSSYLHKPFYELALKRVVWLSIFLASLSLTAVIMSGFEHTLSKQIELAYFVPLLAGHGGNTGGQTVGTVLSALSSGSLHKNDAPAVIVKEAMSGLLVGTILGLLVGPISYYIMGISMHVSVVILCTLPLVSTIAATLGSAIPFVCVWAGLDPSVIAAPAMTSFVDVFGLISYFLIAGKIFQLFGIEL